MHIPLRKIGNSKGIILPAALIAACGLENEVDLRVEGRSIVIDAVDKPRSHWFDSWKAEVDDVEGWDDVLVDAGTEEWVW